VQLVQRLRDQDPAVTPALVWLDRRLAAQGTTPDEIARVEHQRQAAMNVTVRNVIMSMGLMSALEWTEFFESVSLVDHELQADVNYLAMDFATRDSYRHAIEELARGSGRTELDVAREAIGQAARSDVHDVRRNDPGFYLVGAGRGRLEAILGCRASLPRRFLRAYIAGATFGYLGTIGLLTLAVLALPLFVAWASGVRPTVLIVLGLAAVTYRYVEVPIRYKRVALMATRRRAFGVGAVAMLGLVVFSAAFGSQAKLVGAKQDANIALSNALGALRKVRLACW
jgi:cyclic beta-1,2-glucan synthetase